MLLIEAVDKFPPPISKKSNPLTGKVDCWLLAK